MDDRQRKIEIGAGLQESRLNTDLINWLNRYGTAILTVVLVIVAIYAASVQFNRWREARIDDAFEAYLAARGTLGPDGVLQGSPDALLQIARDQRGQASVAELATSDAASIYLGCAVRGLRPGTVLTDIKPEDGLSAEQITEFLKQAATLYDEVADRTRGDADRTVLYHQATLGAAAAAVSLGEFDRARTLLTDLESHAKRTDWPAMAAEARRRLDQLPTLRDPIQLVSAASLPAETDTAAPTAPGVIDLGGGLTVERMPEGFNPAAEGIPLVPEVVDTVEDSQPRQAPPPEE